MFMLIISQVLFRCTTLILECLFLIVVSSLVIGSGLLKNHFPDCKSCVAGVTGAVCDVGFSDGQVLSIGDRSITCLSTPGHTIVRVPFFHFFVILNILYFSGVHIICY